MENTRVQGVPRLVTDRVLAPTIGVSVGFLQKDRIGPQRIPYIKLGDRVLYDMDEVMVAVKSMTVGGPARRGRLGRSAK